MPTLKELCKNCAEGNLERVKSILNNENTIDVNCLESGFEQKLNAIYLGSYSPLMAAAKNGHLEVCKLLIEEKGANINVCGGRKKDYTSLDCAKKWSKNQELIEYLLSKNARTYEELSKQKELLPEDDAHRVTIRVWNNSPSKGISLGHVSLQTHVGGPSGKGIYASFYPTPGTSFFNSPPRYASLTEDIKDESPNVTVSLYSLDVEEINKAYQEFVDKGCNWDVLSHAKSIFSLNVEEIKKAYQEFVDSRYDLNLLSNIKSAFLKESEKPMNCVLLTRHLLEKGGIVKKLMTIPGFNGYFMAGGVVIGLLFGVGVAVATGGVAAPAAPSLGAMAVTATNAAIATGLGIPLEAAAIGGGIGMLGGGGVGTGIGSLTGGIVDLTKTILRPSNVADLVIKAKEAEKSKYEYVSSEPGNSFSYRRIS